MDYATLQKKITYIYKEKLKKLAYLIGGTITIASLFFSFNFIYQHQIEMRVIEIVKTNSLQILFLIIIATLINPLLGLGWRYILLSQDIKIKTGEAIQLYGITQLAKYIPGNIFQFIGRQGIGMSRGMDAYKLAISSIKEILYLGVSGLMFFLIFLISEYTNITLATFSVGLLLIFVSLTIQKKNKICPLIFYILYLLISSLIFISTFKLVIENTNFDVSDYFIESVSFILSWFIGFITPGSPAGLGIRELMLAKTIGQSIPASDLASIVFLSRVISVLADINYFIISFVTHNHSTRIKPSLKH